ncbi:unnamed protein product [Durusdinium trenchii]|uniref:Uncharacterized protein n=1 Tax=Durusdinium trenchii TaxID=1381693 RepID=A0ABP0S0V8_9DINO
MRCIFVSHQWVANSHPDPDGQQLLVLQEALQNIIDGKLAVSMDLASHLQGLQTSAPSAEKTSALMREAFLWLDWFSVPQIYSEGNIEEGEVESPVASVASKSTSFGSQETQIQSIPYFVHSSDMFVVLAPRLIHKDTSAVCNCASWLARGWCRAEMWCKMLSDNPSDILVILVSSSDQADVVTSNWADVLPLDGDFTDSSDRKKIAMMLHHLLRYKLRALAEEQNINLFRFWLARREEFLGMPPRERSLSTFLDDFQFQSLQSARKEQTGMGPMACAALSGNAQLIPLLSKEGFSAQKFMQAMPEVGIAAKSSLLFVALKFAWRQPEVLNALLEAKADANDVHRPSGLHALSLCKSPEAVELLVQRRADVNQPTSSRYQTSILSQACMNCAPAPVISKLLEFRARVDDASAFASLAAVAHMNPHSLDVTALLLTARADVNCRGVAAHSRSRKNLIGCKLFPRMPEVSLCARLEAEWSTSPLGFACFFGRAELASFLVEARADPELENEHGRTPFDLAESQDVLFIALRKGFRYIIVVSEHIMV